VRRILLLGIVLIALVACNNKIEDNAINDRSIEIQLSELSLEESILMEIASNYEVIQLSEFDVEVVYSGFTINEEATSESVQNALGYPDGYYYNNYGNISTGNGFRRWRLSYPDYTDTVVSVVFLSKPEVDEKGREHRGDTYIVGISMVNMETNRGLRVGDAIDSVLDLYGQPAIIQEYRANPVFTEFVYSHNGNNLRIILDRALSRVHNIFIDYNLEQSVRDQFEQTD